jgi:hypothetical protein
MAASPKAAAASAPFVLTTQFVVEAALTACACAAHAAYLLQGYSLVASEGMAAGLRDPVLSFLQLRIGTSSALPAIPVTGPAFYLAAVYALSWYMGSRPRDAAPFALPGVMAAYNAYATLLSGAMFALFVAQFAQHTPGLALLTYRLPRDAPRLWAAAMWVNYQSKYIEYADTLIAVLRGKTDQVSDLQLIHHAEMGPLMFVFCSLCPGGQAALGPCINSFVHFVMYGYYGLTGVKALPALTGAVKPYITTLQMLQFVILLVQSCYHLFFFDVMWDSRCVILQFFLMLQMLCVGAAPGGRARGHRPGLPCARSLLTLPSLSRTKHTRARRSYMFKNFFVRSYLGGEGKGAKDASKAA